MAQAAKVLDFESNELPDIEVKNPMTGKTIYTIPCATEQQIKETFQKAKEASKVLKKMSVAERVEQLKKLRESLLNHQEDIIEQLCLETGKNKFSALIEILGIHPLLNFYIKNAEKLLKDKVLKSPPEVQGAVSKIYYEPLGTVLVITPWNFPLHMIVAGFMCAFTAGNAVVAKPSEVTPLYGLIEKILEDCGFVKDALQIIYGGKETGAMCIDQKPAKILFTGSKQGGSAVMALAAKYVIPVVLELGGKDPMIVLDDCNIERATNAALFGSFLHAGQMCVGVERLFVQENIYDEFIEMLTAKTEQVRTPSRTKDANEQEFTDYNVVTAEFQCKIIEDQIQDAINKGATILTGGKRIGDSHEIEPTLIADVNKEMDILNRETFGPVMVIQKFKTDEEAIEMANDTEFGLSSNVWSSDIERAERVGKQIEAGNLLINDVLAPLGNPEFSFGGVKSSGFGRYMGADGLYTFSNQKAVLINNGKNDCEASWMPVTEEKYETLRQTPALLAHISLKNIYKLIKVGLRLGKLSKKQRYYTRNE